jgi:hypothetical protein
VKRLLCLAVSAAVLTTSTSAVAGEGATRPCVTLGEYRQVTKGMAKVRVHPIFDTSGKRLYINRGKVTSEGREYRVCGHPRRDGSYVQVHYNNFKAGGPLLVGRKKIHVSD